MMGIDFNAAYTVKNWRGVAFRIAGYPKVWAPNYVRETDDDGNEYEFEDGGEWEDDVSGGDVMVYMIGDDYKHRVSIDSLTKIDELDYCACCGQIGCQWDGRERDE